MDVEKVISEKLVTVTNKGMVSIPAIFRKSFDIKDGDKILIIEDEGALKIIPIKQLEDLRKDSYTSKAILEQIKNSRLEEIEREK